MHKQVRAYGRKENVPPSVLPDSDEEEDEPPHVTDDNDSYQGDLAYDSDTRKEFLNDPDAESDTWERTVSDEELEPDDLTNPSLPVKSKYSVLDEEPMLLYDVRMAVPRSIVSPLSSRLTRHCL